MICRNRLHRILICVTMHKKERCYMTKKTKKTIDTIVIILAVIYILFILFCFRASVMSGIGMLIITMAYIIPAYLFFRWLMKQFENHC